MRDYLIRRALLIIPTVIGITLLTFLLTQVVPGGPIEQALHRSFMAEGEAGGGLGSRIGTELSDSDLQVLREFYGFDRPVLERYFRWIGNLARFDFGDSYRYTMPVTELLMQKLPVSAYYGLMSMLIVYLVCIPLGILQAVRHRTWIDDTSSFLILVGYATPPFVLGLILQHWFAVQWSILPLEGFTSSDYDSKSWAGKAWDIVLHSILPLSAYLVNSFAILTALTKNSLIEQLSSDFLRTALAKGVSKRAAILTHAFRNSLIPLATTVGTNVGFILTGSYFIETVFNIDGIGLLGYTSIVARDFPVVMALIFLTSVLSLVGYLISDLCVACVDPRIRFE